LQLLAWHLSIGHPFFHRPVPGHGDAAILHQVDALSSDLRSSRGSGGFFTLLSILLPHMENPFRDPLWRPIFSDLVYLNLTGETLSSINPPLVFLVRSLTALKWFSLDSVTRRFGPFPFLISLLSLHLLSADTYLFVGAGGGLDPLFCF